VSIILEGIDLPNSGQIELIIRPHGKVLSNTRGIYAEAIQIPKGARLIDANAIDYDEFWCRDGQGFSIAVCQGAERIISEQPTILESEEE
jgi:hypothetical protein